MVVVRFETPETQTPSVPLRRSFRPHLSVRLPAFVSNSPKYRNPSLHKRQARNLPRRYMHPPVRPLICMRPSIPASIHPFAHTASIKDQQKAHAHLRRVVLVRIKTTSSALAGLNQLTRSETNNVGLSVSTTRTLLAWLV